ncbi:MAG: hypothetical protein LH629_15245, partial [Ignavibacteria bacterium]|nr:hypothetical protein [Ignavibacteria bacterium]
AVGFEGKLLHSNDCGVTWDFRQTDYKAFRDIYFLKNEMILCGGSGFNHGIIYRLDMNENILQRDTFANELHALCFIDSLTGFCAGYGLILKTTDAGKTWNTTSAQGDFFKSIQYADGKIVALGNNGLLIYSDDEGDTWKKDLQSNNAFQFTNALNFLSINNNQSFICGDNGKIFYNNSDKWLNLNSSLDIDFTASIFNDDKFYLTARDGKIYSGSLP